MVLLLLVTGIRITLLTSFLKSNFANMFPFQEGNCAIVHVLWPSYSHTEPAPYLEISLLSVNLIIKLDFLFLPFLGRSLTLWLRHVLELSV